MNPILTQRSWDLRPTNSALAAFVFFFTAILSSCGTNTDDPVYPMLAFLSTVGTPAITGATPIENYNYETMDYRIEFDVSYYVTNSEDEFIGYNLYISSTSTAPENNYSGNPYLPNGTEPTFPHGPEEASTASGDLITQRVTHYHPLPELVPFYMCEKYYFRMNAITRSGVYSNMGPQVERCATLEGSSTIDPSFCPLDSPCYAP